MGHVRAVLAGAVALIVLAGSALGQDSYEFDTGSGQLKLNGTVTQFFNGVLVVDRGISGGVRTWTVMGDMNVPVQASVTFKGDNLARVLVGGDMSVPSSASIKADANEQEAGPGGGDGGNGGSGGSPGGIGGTGGGGANSIEGDPGQTASGSSGGMGGLFPRRGGDGGDGTMVAGIAGGSGFSLGIGSNGQNGDEGADGSSGQLGINNTAASSLPGSGSAGGVGGPGGSIPGSGGAGGASGGGAGGPGDPGTPGNLGFTGGTGFDGLNAQTFSPGIGALLVLNAGNGGAGGGGGGSGGGGGGGTTGGGGGGGGGGNGNPVEECIGGGGGGGGAGGSGGQGGQGGTGGRGANGGGGGGGVAFIVQGRLDLDGTLSARGADAGMPSEGSDGIDGAAGGQGGPGGGGGSPSCGSAGPGGVGGNGGMGGTGGTGGTGGEGGGGGGGTGGCIFVAATVLAGSGNIDLSGGMGAHFPAGSGRIVYSEAAAGSFNYIHVSNPSLVSPEVALSQSTSSPYFASLNSPNIVASAPGQPGLDAGPGPFGLLPNALVDSAIDAARAGAPAHAAAVIVRFDLGPSGFEVGYNNSFSIGVAEIYDMYVVVNLLDHAAPVLFNGTSIAQMPFARRGAFGGSGDVEPIVLPEGRCWAALGFENGQQTIAIGIGSFAGSVLLADPAEGQSSVGYLVVSCRADINSDGSLDFFDVQAFLGAFAAHVEPGDWNDDSLYNFFDVQAFLNDYAAGCP